MPIRQENPNTSSSADGHRAPVPSLGLRARVRQRAVNRVGQRAQILSRPHRAANRAEPSVGLAVGPRAQQRQQRHQIPSSGRIWCRSRPPRTLWARTSTRNPSRTSPQTTKTTLPSRGFSKASEAAVAPRALRIRRPRPRSREVGVTLSLRTSSTTTAPRFSDHGRGRIRGLLRDKSSSRPTTPSRKWTTNSHLRVNHRDHHRKEFLALSKKPINGRRT